MTLKSSESRFWLIISIISVLLIWLLKGMLLPFVAALAISYFLNPAVNIICRYKIPRWLGVLLTLLSFVTFVMLILLLVVPLLRHQIGAMIDALPTYIEIFRSRVVPFVENSVAKLSPGEVDKLRDAAGEYTGDLVGWFGTFLRSLITHSLALFDVLTLLVVTPLVTFYLLRDWPKLTATIDVLLPRKQYAIIRAELSEIDRTLSGFIRGQATVCLCLGAIYSVGLSLVGLQYGASVGIVAGLLSFIPYTGSTFGIITSLILATTQFTEPAQILMVIGVFVVGQIAEGYFLTPNLVGDKVGLHPVWILFALFAGGSLLGFLGVLIAVPVAAVCGVLVRFALRHYKASAIYNHQPSEP